MEIFAFTKNMVRKLYIPVGKSNHILCQRKVLEDKRFPEIINENTLSALDNYAKHKNATIYLEDLNNDMFNDVAMHVYKQGTEGHKSIPLSFSKAKEDFGGCMRDLYKTVEKAINDLKG